MAWKNMVLLYSSIPGTEETKVIRFGFPSSFPVTASPLQNYDPLPKYLLPQSPSELSALVPT